MTNNNNNDLDTMNHMMNDLQLYDLEYPHDLVSQVEFETDIEIVTIVPEVTEVFPECIEFNEYTSEVTAQEDSSEHESELDESF